MIEMQDVWGARNELWRDPYNPEVKETVQYLENMLQKQQNELAAKKPIRLGFNKEDVKDGWYKIAEKFTEHYIFSKDFFVEKIFGNISRQELSSVKNWILEISGLYSKRDFKTAITLAEKVSWAIHLLEMDDDLNLEISISACLSSTTKHFNKMAEQIRGAQQYHQKFSQYL